MTDALQALIETLRRASRGEAVSLDEARSARFRHPDTSVDKFANECWRRLINFCDDEDIRSRDAAYDVQMRQELSWRAEELTERIKANL